MHRVSSPDRLIRCLPSDSILPTTRDSRRRRQEGSQRNEPANSPISPSVRSICRSFVGRHNVALPVP